VHLLVSWLPGAELTRDRSWGLVGTTVLELRSPDGRTWIAKAGDESDHQLVREIHAYRQWLGPWTSQGCAPRLVQADEAAKLLVTTCLPGELVEGTTHEHRTDTYRQAGELLAQFHGQLTVTDHGEYEHQQKEKTLAWLRGPHRIAPADATLLAGVVEVWPTPESVVVPTHGDWQPRNWLVHDDRVSIIDFGRAELRPAMTDFGRLAAQQFRAEPTLEEAFLQGYGEDPREPGAWLRVRIRDAVGTAAWAYKVGDERFEQQGHRMIGEVIADLAS
jgi:aminoglycoside phosphotransferase (APT) family kinase protein